MAGRISLTARGEEMNNWPQWESNQLSHYTDQSDRTFYADKIKQDEMDGACSLYEMIISYRILVNKPNLKSLLSRT
jgi:hypothetical protein